MNTGLGIVVAGLLVAGAILINGYMERAPLQKVLEECTASRMSTWDRDPEYWGETSREDWEIRSRADCYQEFHKLK